METNFPFELVELITEALALGHAQGHPPSAWRHQPPDVHLGKFFAHYGRYLEGKTDEPHLALACARWAFYVCGELQRIKLTAQAKLEAVDDI